VGGYITLLGHTRFDYSDGHRFDPSLCAAACNARTAANARDSTVSPSPSSQHHPPPPPSPLVPDAYFVCSQFAAFELHRDAVPVTMVCVDYASVWDPAAYSTWTGAATAGAAGAASMPPTTAHHVTVYRRRDYRYPPICADPRACGPRYFRGGDCSGWGPEYCRPGRAAEPEQLRKAAAAVHTASVSAATTEHMTAVKA